MSFNISENKFSNLAYGCINDTTASNKFDANGLSIVSFKKHDFTIRVFILILVYRKQSSQLREFSKLM